MRRHLRAMEQYLEDYKLHGDEAWKFWQARWVDKPNFNGCWVDLKNHPTWENNKEYRRKVTTIIIGGENYVLPRPLTHAVPGQIVYYLDPCTQKGYSIGEYQETPFFMNHLKYRCLFEKEDHVIKWILWWKNTVINKVYG